MFIQLFDNVAVLIQRLYLLNGKSNPSKTKVASGKETSFFAFLSPSKDPFYRRNPCWSGRVLELNSSTYVTVFSFRNEVDIKGHDGVIYKGRIDVEKLPAVDSHKKSSMSLLAPPLPKSRLDVHPIPPIQSQQARETTVIDSERSDGSPMFPNLQPVLPREESFT